MNVTNPITRTITQVYPDTSAWNCLCNQTVEPHALVEALAACGATLVLGFNVMYEMAKLFHRGRRELMTYMKGYLALRVPIVQENWALLIEEALDVTHHRIIIRMGRAIESWNLSRGYFHMADFVSGYNDYQGWTQAEKRYRLRLLIRIICKHVRVLVGNAVVQSDFNNALQMCPSTVIGTAYRFCAFLVLPAVDHWRRRSPRRKPVALVFESGNKMKNEYGRILAQLGDFERTREKYGSSAFIEASKKEWVPLQAADLIAYATYKCLAQTRIDDWLEHEFETLFKLPHQGILYSDAALIEKCLRSFENAKRAYAENADSMKAKSQTA